MFTPEMWEMICRCNIIIRRSLARVVPNPYLEARKAEGTGPYRTFEARSIPPQRWPDNVELALKAEFEMCNAAQATNGY